MKQQQGYNFYKSQKDLFGPENMSMLIKTDNGTDNPPTMPPHIPSPETNEHPIAKQIRLRLDALNSGDPVQRARAIIAKDTGQFLLHLRDIKRLYGLSQ